MVGSRLVIISLTFTADALTNNYFKGVGTAVMAVIVDAGLIVSLIIDCVMAVTVGLIVYFFVCQTFSFS